MFNQRIAELLIQIENDLDHILDCTNPNKDTLSGISLHIQLKELRKLLYKLNSNLFMAAPKELSDEILKAKKTQNDRV
jgi:hypothetical protein